MSNGQEVKPMIPGAGIPVNYGGVIGMKLTDEIKKYWRKFRVECDRLVKNDIGGTIAEQIPMVNAVLEAFDVINALHTKNEQLRKEIAEYENDCAVLPEDLSVTETVIQLKEKISEIEKIHKIDIAENEQLRAACATKDEALKIMRKLCVLLKNEKTRNRQMEGAAVTEKWIKQIEQALSSINIQEYHNPGDVAALKLAGEYMKNHRCYCKENYKCIRCQTLSVIEKAKAGGEES